MLKFEPIPVYRFIRCKLCEYRKKVTKDVDLCQDCEYIAFRCVKLMNKGIVFLNTTEMQRKLEIRYEYAELLFKLMQGMIHEVRYSKDRFGTT